MKRPKLRKASKRLSCHKRYKIQKKIREHNRKLRKEAKKKGISRKIKKDPGVPNSAPFKEEILREAEQRKLQLEEEREKNKLAKQKERAAEKRKKEKAATGGDAEPKAKKAKKQERVKPPEGSATDKRLRCSELNKVIDASDVIIEVLDARDPLGCRCPQLEEAVLRHEGKKRLMLALNKIDLVPKENVEKWLEYLQAEFPTFAFKASRPLQDRTVQQSKKRRKTNAAVDHSRAAASFGTDSLLQALTCLADAQDSEKMLKVGVVGFPNVGKSSLINSMKGMRACHVGLQRGITKSIQEVHISKNVKMIDSPGIIAAPSNPGDAMALRSLQVEENQESTLEAVRALLKQCNQQHIMLQYNVPDYRNALEFLTFYAKKRGFLQKGSVPSTEQAAVAFLNDMTGPKLSYHCKPPERRGLPSYLSDDLIAVMQSGLNMEKLRMANKETLKDVRFPSLASSIGFTSKGPTTGLLNASEIPEDRPSVKEPAKVEEEEEEEEEEEDEDGEDEDEEEEMGEDNEEMESDEETTEDSNPVKQKKTTQASAPSEKVKVIVPPALINVDLSSSQQNDDDAYDFNTDFV